MLYSVLHVLFGRVVSLSPSLPLIGLNHISLVPEQSRVAVYVRKTLAKKRHSGGRGGEGRGLMEGRGAKC